MSKFILSFLIICAGITGQAQDHSARMDTLLVGTWKGTSLCQKKNSPCHDETVVYHISKNNAADTFFIHASKIVNGVEDEMGILPLVYHKNTGQLTSSNYGNWTFRIKGNQLEGTLFVNGDLYRKIIVDKQFR